MNNSGTIGVVTVTYNSDQVLDGFLRSVKCQTYSNYLLYVIDNASRDKTVAKLESHADPRMRVIRNVVNLGVAEGNNQGIRAALADRCDYVLFINNDVVFGSSLFATLVSELAALQCELVTPKILFEDGVRIWAAGSSFQPLKGYLGTNTGEGEKDNGQFESPRRIQNAPTCCLMARSGVFDGVGVMDAKYFVYHDDADFLFRAWRAGMTMSYTPRTCVYHKVSTLTGGSDSPFTIRYNARGHVYFMLKNLGLWRCLFFLPALQLRMAIKVLVRTIKWDEYKIRQRAFFEGISVWRS